MMQDLLFKIQGLAITHFTARGGLAPFRLSPPPNLRELLLPFRSDGYASEIAVDLPRRKLTESLHYIRTQEIVKKNVSGTIVHHSAFVRLST